jgi:outer membrane protein TolC
MKQGLGLVLSLLAFAAFSGAGAQDTAVPAPSTAVTGAPQPDSSTSLTLEDAQKEALDHSPIYRKAQDAEREAGWGQLEAVSDGFVPHISAKGQDFFRGAVKYGSEEVNFGGSPINFPENFPETTLSLDASFDLFDGFRNIHKLDAANNSHEAARVQSDFSLLQLQETVRLKFYESQASQLLSDMADQNVKTLQDHLRIVQDQLDNGQATKYDVLQVQVELSEAQSDQITAHDNLALARESLALAMGLKTDDRSLSGQLPGLDENELLKVVSDADFKDSPDLKTKQLQALAAEDQSAASHSFWFPKVSLIGEYAWYDSQSVVLSPFSLTNTGIYQDSYFIGASATWDILDGGLSVAKANEADEKAKQAKDDYEGAQLQTPYDFDLWKRRLVSSLALYKAKLTNVDTAKENARLATLGFKAGTRTTNDVLTAEFDEYRASAGLVQSQLDALEALINLEFVTGKRLTHD